MKVLIVAPQPFYQERGTPIAVDLLIRALSERGDHVDLLTFHEGEDRDHPNLTIHRIATLPGTSDIRPGWSLKKLVCDAALFGKLLGLVWRQRYDVIHSVEEAGFMAFPVCRLRSIPLVYDMDSCMSEQLVDKYPFLSPARRVMDVIEAVPMRGANAVVPVCQALADVAAGAGATNIHIIPDVSLLPEGDASGDGPTEDLRAEMGIDGVLFMYVGNLESYQGIELMVESFARAAPRMPGAHLVVIGGAPADVTAYREQARARGLDDRVNMIGPRPIGVMSHYLRQADVLVSPRTRGRNTPMKVYSYLDSGVAVLATDLPTHTQVMTDAIAVLRDPEPEAFAEGMVRLADNAELRGELAGAARAYIEAHHSYPAFRAKVHRLYGELEREGSQSGARPPVDESGSGKGPGHS
jgi:glycosyltransferase involved in cell wall biosynthesis